MRYFGHFRGFNIFLLNLEVSRGILVILKVSRLLWRFRGILGHFRYYGGILVIVVFIYLFIYFLILVILKVLGGIVVILKVLGVFWTFEVHFSNFGGCKSILVILKVLRYFSYSYE